MNKRLWTPPPSGHDSRPLAFRQLASPVKHPHTPEREPAWHQSLAKGTIRREPGYGRRFVG